MSDGSITYQLSRGWTRMHEAVFLLPGFRPSWEQRVLALCMRGGDGTVASHVTAGALLDLDGCARDEVHLYGRSRWTCEGVRVHRTSLLPPCDVTQKTSIPLTNASRTLLDLGAVMDADHVEVALECALRRGLTSVPRLRWRLQEVGGRGHAGSAALRKLLDRREPGTRPLQSVLEVRFLQGLCRRKLPAPVRQFEVRVGQRRRFIDFGFPHALLGIEVGGRRFHSGPAAAQRDSRRHNELTALGWRILYFTWDDVQHRMDYVIDCIERELRPRLQHP